MNPIVESLNFYLALGGVLSFVVASILVYDLLRAQALKHIVEKYGLWIALLVVINGVFFALLYSDVFGFEPCGFCWLARIFLFSQLPLLLVALFYRDQQFARYGLVLSVIGIGITLYHHYLQMGGNAFVKCPAAGSVDCAKRIMFELDFMTFPLLGTAGFTLLSVLYYYILRLSKGKY